MKLVKVSYYEISKQLEHFPQLIMYDSCFSHIRCHIALQQWKVETNIKQEWCVYITDQSIVPCTWC